MPRAGFARARRIGDNARLTPGPAAILAARAPGACFLPKGDR